jgi:hypothetical protein
LTTYSQLDKVADGRFNSEMRRRGFAVEKKFYYWRKRGPLFDVLWPEIIGGGALLRVYVTILSPWIDDQEGGNFTEFPVRTGLIGGTLSTDFPERVQAGIVFKIETQEEISASLEEILLAVGQNAIPWFSSINSPETYFAYLGARGFYPDREFREQIKRGIEIGFAREPQDWGIRYTFSRSDERPIRICVQESRANGRRSQAAINQSGFDMQRSESLEVFEHTGYLSAHCSEKPQGLNLR